MRAFGLVLTKNGDETQCNLVPGGGKMKDPGNETGCNALPTAKERERRRFPIHISFVTEQYLIYLLLPRSAHRRKRKLSRAPFFVYLGIFKLAIRDFISWRTVGEKHI